MNTRARVRLWSGSGRALVRVLVNMLVPNCHSSHKISWPLVGLWSGSGWALVGLWLGSGRALVGLWSGSGRALVGLWLGSGQAPIGLWLGFGRVLVGSAHGAHSHVQS